MTTATTAIRLDDPASLAALVPDGGPGWLEERRRAALDRFAAEGVPTRRHEEWRYTNLRPLTQLDLVAGEGPGTVDAQTVASLALPGVDGPRIVLVDGHWSPDLSDLAGIPASVTVVDLLTACADDATGLAERLGQAAGRDGGEAVSAGPVPSDQAFVDLNEALMMGGAYVHVPAGVHVDAPIHVLSITTGRTGTLTSTRTVIVADDDAQVTVVEDLVGLDDDAVTATNAVTEVFAGDRAKAIHILVEREGRSAISISRFASRQGAESNVESHSILLGGKLVRNEVNPKIEGAGADSLLNGLYVPTGDQHVDNHMRVEHRVGACTSRQFYRGMLPDKTTGVFSGRIVVSDDASETDAVQNCQNLLLSTTSRAVTKPQLEIYDADVQCTHGATTGQLVPEQLFYLRARGITEEEARGILVYAFASEGIDRLEIEDLRQWVHAQFRERLPYASEVDEGLQ